MSAADVIRARLAASASASGTDFRVEGLTARGGYAVVAPAAGVATDGYLPEETAELFAAAPADIAELLDLLEKAQADLAESRRELASVLQSCRRAIHAAERVSASHSADCPCTCGVAP